MNGSEATFMHGTQAGLQLTVYALPRGGVPVAVEISRRLNASLDLAMVRKIGAPFNPEREPPPPALSPGRRGRDDGGGVGGGCRLSQPALSQHLAMLREVGSVAIRKEAQAVLCRLADPNAASVLALLRDLDCPPADLIPEGGQLYISGGRGHPATRGRGDVGGCARADEHAGAHPLASPGEAGARRGRARHWPCPRTARITLANLAYNLRRLVWIEGRGAPA